MVTTTGTVTLSTVPDFQLPQGFSAPPNVTTAGATTYEFQVLYTDNVAIDVSTLGDSDVRIYSPTNGFLRTATFVGFTPVTGGDQVTATYSITPPGGSWNSIDNGSYLVLMAARQVRDTAGHFVESGELGGFTVSIAGFAAAALQESSSEEASSSAAVDRGEAAAKDAAVSSTSFAPTQEPALKNLAQLLWLSRPIPATAVPRPGREERHQRARHGIRFLAIADPGQPRSPL